MSHLTNERVWDALTEIERETQPPKRRNAAAAMAAFAAFEQRVEYALYVLTRAARQFSEYEEIHKQAGNHGRAANASWLLEDCERAIELLAG